MCWKLIEVEDVEATIDDSGLYVTINRVLETPADRNRGYTFRIRADLMINIPDVETGTLTTEPIMSWIGTANAVRKQLIRFIREHYGYAVISTEHASYIGYELHRAETTPNYVQD